MSVIKALLTTIPVFYSMSGENNADLLVITGINTFLIKKVVTKLSKEGYSNSFQHPHPPHPPPKKSCTRNCQNVELNMCKLGKAVACWILNQDYSKFVLALISKVK